MRIPYGTHTVQKMKPRGNEDKYSSRMLNNEYFYAGVYDGHNGAKAAELSAELIPKLIEQYLPERSLVLTLKLAFTEADSAIPDSSGCTATTLVMHGTYACVAHVGDSRAVLCRNDRAIDITIDHHLDCASERQRIEECEQRLRKPLIVGSRVQGLMLTRSLGDHNLTNEIVPHPVIREFRCTDEDQYIIIASDGLWDVISSEDAVKYVKKHGLKGAEDIAQALVEHALSLYRRRAMRMDDITCMVVYLQPDEKKRHRLSWMFRSEMRL